MGQYIPRTAADETADALTALDEAHRALRDLRAQLDGIIANPDGAAGIAHQARRNSEIASASIATAQRAIHGSNRAAQLKVVS